MAVMRDLFFCGHGLAAWFAGVFWVVFGAFAVPAVAQDGFDETQFYRVLLECQATFGISGSLQNVGVDLGEAGSFAAERVDRLGEAVFILREAAGRSIGLEQEQMDADLYAVSEMVVQRYGGGMAVVDGALTDVAATRLLGELTVCDQLLVLVADVITQDE